MGEYSEECLRTFLKDQGQLFDEPVAETLEEAEAFLEDCMAVVVENIDEVKEFLEEEGMDIQGMSDRNYFRQKTETSHRRQKIWWDRMNCMTSSYILCFALDMSLQRSIVLPAVLLRGNTTGKRS